MAEWVAKRFWSTVRTEQVEAGWRILLDSRSVRTPAGRPLVVPTEALGAAIAREWDRQDTVIDPATMPVSRAANSALDKVAPEHGPVVDMLAEYGETDLLCYRAERPRSLVARQSELWDPMLDWAADRFDARLIVTQGVMPVAQPLDALARLAQPMRRLSPFRLAAFHDFVVLTGSLVLANAVAERRLAADAAWALSRLDEEWQAAEWGHDDEAKEAAERKRRDMLDAETFWLLAL